MIQALQFAERAAVGDQDPMEFAALYLGLTFEETERLVRDLVSAGEIQLNWSYAQYEILRTLRIHVEKHDDLDELFLAVAADTGQPVSEVRDFLVKVFEDEQLKELGELLEEMVAEGILEKTYTGDRESTYALVDLSPEEMRKRTNNLLARIAPSDI